MSTQITQGPPGGKSAGCRGVASLAGRSGWTKAKDHHGSLVRNILVLTKTTITPEALMCIQALSYVSEVCRLSALSAWMPGRCLLGWELFVPVVDGTGNSA